MSGNWIFWTKYTVTGGWNQWWSNGMRRILWELQPDGENDFNQKECLPKAIFYVDVQVQMWRDWNKKIWVFDLINCVISWPYTTLHAHKLQPGKVLITFVAMKIDWVLWLVVSWEWARLTCYSICINDNQR